MKIIKNTRKKWLIIHEHYCQKKSTRGKALIKRNNKIANKAKIKILAAPQIMCLKDNFEEVTKFLNKLREHTSDSTKHNHFAVDFKQITKLMPGAALILAAELYRWQTLYNIKLKPYKPKKWGNDVKRLFNEMGLFELLNITKYHKNTKLKSPGPQTFFKFLTGVLSDGELANKLMENMSPLIGSRYNEQLLYDALCEAMTNVMQHAYSDKLDIPNPDLKYRWWLSGSFNRDTKIMTVLLFDQGIGIPASLKTKPFFQDVIEFIKEKHYTLTNQGRLIQAAIEVGRSRTKLGYRGKGLKQILKFSSDSNFGSLYIVSRKGEYFFNDDHTEKTRSCPIELGGTFIQWKIKL